jgi:hypothetical protein
MQQFPHNPDPGDTSLPSDHEGIVMIQIHLLKVIVCVKKLFEVNRVKNLVTFPTPTTHINMSNKIRRLFQLFLSTK